MKKSILDVVHSSAAGLNDAGAIDTQTMRDFDKLCLPPVKMLKGSEIRQMRERFGLSQPVFAGYLNSTKSTVSKWERGEKVPSGTSLKLLNVANNHGLQVLVG